MRSDSITDGIIVEHIEDLTDIVEAVPEVELPPDIVVRFRNVASRRPGTSAEWPPTPKKPAPTARGARIYRAVIRPQTRG